MPITNPHLISKFDVAPSIRKALTGFVGAVGAGLGTAMADGDLTRPECIVALGAGILAGTAVYRIPNAE